MTTARSMTATLVVALLAWLGASAALGSPSATEATNTPAVAVVQAAGNAGDARPAAGAKGLAARADDIALARAVATRLAPGSPVQVRVVSGAADAQAVIAAAAAEAGTVVGIGRDVRPALASAKAAWPDLRIVTAG